MDKAKLIDGKVLRDKIITRLGEEVSSLAKTPKLVIVFVGQNEASERYIGQKQKAAEEIKAKAVIQRLSEGISQEQLNQRIQELNKDETVDGIIVQLPLPKQLDREKITQTVDPAKDVDGLTPNSKFQPATVAGILEILREYKVKLAGQTAVIIGQSNLVGKPLATALEKAGSKIIPIDINTPLPIDPLVRQGDIVVSAVGKINLVTSQMVKNNAVVVDVGINKDPKTGKLVGDVDFEKVKEKASLITPVPGGVGPMTVAMLMKNLIQAAKLRNSR